MTRPEVFHARALRRERPYSVIVKAKDAAYLRVLTLPPIVNDQG